MNKKKQQQKHVEIMNDGQGKDTVSLGTIWRGRGRTEDARGVKWAMTAKWHKNEAFSLLKGA